MLTLSTTRENEPSAKAIASQNKICPHIYTRASLGGHQAAGRGSLVGSGGSLVRIWVCDRRGPKQTPWASHDNIQGSTDGHHDLIMPWGIPLGTCKEDVLEGPEWQWMGQG